MNKSLQIVFGFFAALLVASVSAKKVLWDESWRPQFHASLAEAEMPRLIGSISSTLYGLVNSIKVVQLKSKADLNSFDVDTSAGALSFNNQVFVPTVSSDSELKTLKSDVFLTYVYESKGSVSSFGVKEWGAKVMTNKAFAKGNSLAMKGFYVSKLKTYMFVEAVNGGIKLRRTRDATSLTRVEEVGTVSPVANVDALKVNSLLGFDVMNVDDKFEKFVATFTIGTSVNPTSYWFTFSVTYPASGTAAPTAFIDFPARRFDGGDSVGFFSLLKSGKDMFVVGRISGNVPTGAGVVSSLSFPRKLVFNPGSKTVTQEFFSTAVAKLPVSGATVKYANKQVKKSLALVDNSVVKKLKCTTCKFAVDKVPLLKISLKGAGATSNSYVALKTSSGKSFIKIGFEAPAGANLDGGYYLDLSNMTATNLITKKKYWSDRNVDMRGNAVDMEILVDQSVIEVMLDGGRLPAITARYFVTEPHYLVDFMTEAATTINAEVTRLRSKNLDDVSTTTPGKNGAANLRGMLSLAPAFLVVLLAFFI